MTPRELLQIQGLLFTQPENAWLRIKENAFNWKQVFFYYLIPLLFLSSLSVVFFMGEQFQELEYSINEVFVITFIGSLGAIYISGIIMASLAPRFGGITSLNDSIALLSFGYSPVYLTSIFSSIHESLQFLNIIGMIFMVFIFFRGTSVLIQVPEHKKMGFSIVSLIILFSSRILISGFMVAVIALLNAESFTQATN